MNAPKKENQPKVKENYPFYTIGHSTRPLEEFVELLQALEISLLVDVRTVPRSRTNPQYNRDVLPNSLAPFKIRYEHIALLGGLRGKSPDVSDDMNAFWQNGSFRYFADYAMSEGFREGLAQLIKLGRKHRCAIMCAEVVWWRCHRRIITDYLLTANERVFHILSKNNVQEASLNQSARMIQPGVLRYPAAHEDGYSNMKH